MAKFGKVDISRPEAFFNQTKSEFMSGKLAASFGDQIGEAWEYIQAEKKKNDRENKTRSTSKKAKGVKK